MTQTKALAAFELKAADTETRTFEGLAATWDLDLGGDVIHKGAFAKSLKSWKASGRIIPLIDQHNYFSVRHVLGKLLDAEETDDGLRTRWKVTEGQDGDELLHRLRGGMVDGLSIGYETVDSEPETRGGQTVRHLKEINLVEVSAVIWGMNPGALINTHSVKSLLDGVEATALSDEDRKDLRALASKIGQLLRPATDPAKAAEPATAEKEVTPPDATPAAAADSQAETKSEPEYAYTDALLHRIQRVRLQRV
jgi:uncharacterized protein